MKKLGLRRGGAIPFPGGFTNEDKEMGCEKLE